MKNMVPLWEFSDFRKNLLEQGVGACGKKGAAPNTQEEHNGTGLANVTIQSRGRRQVTLLTKPIFKNC